MQYMHAFILGIDRDSPTEGIHGIGGTLDNTRENLRSGSRRENQRDRMASGQTSKYKGVCWNADAQRWASNIQAGETYTFIGYFDDEIEAARSYDSHARTHHGEFARFNFPELGETSALNPEIELICLNCNEPFQGPHGLKFCSKDCLKVSTLKKRNCLNCDNEKTGYGKFCDSTCMLNFEEKCKNAEVPEPVEVAIRVKLTLGKWCLIDASDVDLILGRDRNRKWSACEGNGNWYAIRKSKPEEFDQYGCTVRMHRLVMNLSKGDNRDVDHVDGDGLNNRRFNLRIVDNSTNHMNVFSRGSSPFKGVTNLGNGFYLARIKSGGSYKYIGRFGSDDEAARAYDKEARAVHGSNGRYNFPESGESGLD